MKKLALALILALAPALAWGQCTGIFPNQTVCGNATGSSSTPSPTSISGFTGLFANPTGAVGLTTVNGSATTALRSDSAPPLSSSVQSALTQPLNQILLGTGAFGFSSSTTLPTTAFANPTASIGLSAINGSAVTAMRSDAAPALSQTISPTMTGVWAYTNILSTSSNVLQATAPQLLANGSNLIAGFQKASSRTWNWSYDTQNFGSGGSVSALKLCSDLACAVPIWITDYGFLNIGNIVAGYPMVSPNQSDTTGPALRVVGDIAGGDNLYFGSSEYAITAISNSGGVVEITYSATTNPTLATGNKIMIAGSQTALNNGPSPAPTNWTITVVDSTHFTLNGSTFTAACSSNCGYFGTGADPQTALLTLPGGFPSARVISPSQRTGLYNHDWSGGATIIACPDVDLVGTEISCNQGELILGAYGSGPSGNDVRFQVRSGPGTVANIAVISSTGLAMAAPLKLQAVAFASLPTCNGAAQGYAVLITNSNTSTFGATITGAGGSIGIALCDGTNWTYR